MNTGLKPRRQCWQPDIIRVMLYNLTELLISSQQPQCSQLHKQRIPTLEFKIYLKIYIMKKAHVNKITLFSDCIEAYIYSSQDPQQWVQPLLALPCNDIEIYDHYFHQKKKKKCCRSKTNPIVCLFMKFAYALIFSSLHNLFWQQAFHYVII